MQANYYVLLFLIFADLISIAILYLSCKSFQTRLLVGIAIACFNFASCLGIIFNADNEKYLLSAIAFMIVMVLIMSKVLDGRYSFTVGGRKKIFFDAAQIENEISVIKWLGIIYLLIMLISTVYPNNYLTQLSPASFTVTGARFALKLTRSTGIGWVMARVKLVLMPFFFIWLFTLRQKARVFISIFVLESFCQMLQNQVITSRSHYLQIVFFIIIYLALEKKISKRQLIIITVSLAAVSVILMVWFKNLIQGKQASFDSFGDTLMFLIQSEYNGGPLRLGLCKSLNGELNFIRYIIHCITAPLFFLPDDGFPTLSYFFTSRVLGLTYGQVGYYVILPGAFGEGLMVLGKHFAWVYGAFIGIYTGSLFRYLRSNDYLRYVYVYFMIQFAFAFRGGIQSFVMRSFNCIFYFLIVMVVLHVIRRFHSAQKK